MPMSCAPDAVRPSDMVGHVLQADVCEVATAAARLGGPATRCHIHLPPGTSIYHESWSTMHGSVGHHG